MDLRPNAPGAARNVIPFAKPRALAAQAAAPTRNGPVEIQKSGADPLSHLRPPMTMQGSAIRTAREAPRPLPATPVATGRAAPAPLPHHPPAPVSHGSLALAQPVLAPPQPVLAPPPVSVAPPVSAPPAPVSAPPPPVRAEQDFDREAPTVFAPPPVFDHAPPAVAKPSDKWAVFEKLGLGKPKLPSAQQASTWMVNAYRMIGFAILTIIVVVLIGYIISTVFFYMSNSWAVPMKVTASDEKVVSLSAQVGEQQNARDRLADELNQAERAIVVQQQFQDEFVKSIKGDLASRKKALEKMRSLAGTAAGTRAQIAGQNRAYASAQRRRMQQEYAAGLIDRDGMLNGNYQVAQIAGSTLSLAEKQAEYETRAAELEATARSLDAILANAESTGDVALSYEVLQIKQQYETSRLELAKAVEARDTLKASLARQDKLLAALKGSAYLRAVNDNATVAFLPYDNVVRAKPGEPVYACKLTMVFCYHVGEVIELLPGEVTGRHPSRDKTLRGQFVEIKLDEENADAGELDVVFIGGKPFIL
ncbi:MAG: hypothetical protein JNL83_03820 [Myxococcales bacterium]|nr:hypothetical protein [Myxococcales bacterium]